MGWAVPEEEWHIAENGARALRGNLTKISFAYISNIIYTFYIF